MDKKIVYVKKLYILILPFFIDLFEKNRNASEKGKHPIKVSN